MKPSRVKIHKKIEELTPGTAIDSQPYPKTMELFPDGEKKVEWNHVIISLNNAKTDSDKWFKRLYLILNILNSQFENAENSQKMYSEKMNKKGKTRILTSDTENIIPYAIQIEIIGKRLYKDEPNKKNQQGKISPMWINPILIDMFESGLIHTWKIVKMKSGGLLYKISDKGKDALSIIESYEVENFHKKYPTDDDHPLRVLFDKLQS